MNKQISINVKKGDKAVFNNNTDVCVGTGRMGLALQKEYLDQLKVTQQEIGFKYIRGHGLFCDDMAVCRAYEDESGKQKYEYNYTYIDLVMDSYLELGIKPFIELGFMPEAMASGDNTVFYWKGNITPPKDYNDWADMIKALLRHLIERYGKDEVLQWPVEVWNEPNLSNFWKDGNMEEYFVLYKYSALAVKEVDQKLQVGGPSICGVNDQVWLKSFLEFVRDNKVPLDFVSRHHYTINPTKMDGHYSYVSLHDLDEGFEFLEASRTIIDSFPEYKGMDIHITEFNTAYVPDSPLHDTNLNAAYLAAMLSRLGDCHASYSYWTFGDIFEERDVPFTPFYGGFGMLANGSIAKPTFWTFAFYKKLVGSCVHRSNNAVIVRTDDGGYRGVLWNADTGYTGESLKVSITLPADKGEYCFLTKTVDEKCCNPLKLWHDIGEPSHLQPEQLKLLKDHAVPLLQSESVAADGGEINTEQALGPNAVVYFELDKVERTSDRGFSYERTMRKDQAES